MLGRLAQDHPARVARRLRVAHAGQEVEGHGQRARAEACDQQHGVYAQPAGDRAGDREREGNEPNESSQSTLLTRPRSAAGTTRCISVTHTINPAAQQPSPANEIAIACQGTPANA